MSRPAATARQRLAPVEPAVDTLEALVDWARLGRLGWDPRREVFAPAADDVVFGFVECATAGCARIAAGGAGLCRSCAVRHRRSTGSGGDEPTQGPSTPIPARADGLCALCSTVGHERPARSRGLCRVCLTVIGQRGQSVAAYLDGDDEFPPATPRLSFGACQVTACERWADRGEPALCELHERAWRRAGRPRGAPFELWRAQTPGVDTGSPRAVLRGLGRRVQVELLYGLQCAADAERRTPVDSVQRAAQLLRAHDAPTIVGLPDECVRRVPLLAFVRDRVTLALTDPVTETAGDDWDLRVFGRPRGRLHFGRISQPWLKEAAKCWAVERLGTLEHAAQRPNVVQRVVHCVGLLSESLRRHRRDRGVDPALLGRADAVALCADLANMERTGRFSRTTRGIWLAGVDQFLRESRDIGLTHPGRPLAGLGEDMALHRGDRIPRRSNGDDEEGRALPPTVVDQLLDPAALDLLEDIAGVDVRTMVELQARVGRRTAELCQLRWECLSFDEIIDETGRPRPAPVLVHDMPKIAVRGYHLPIDDDTAAIIRDQQARTMARYPDTATTRLALFPAPHDNPHGVKTRLTTGFRGSLRAWLTALPTLAGPGGEPYDRATISPYSFRHSYAQRHADAGTPVEVLAALMGHRQLTTTQGYYRVTQKRKRTAVDVLAAMQLDRAGQRQRPTVERLLEAEHLRDAVGQVAVPFGVCREPTNVKAHGHACPFRHQCFGCTHFRSDPSFLPELRGYLNRLLADRERLLAAVPELEDWARNAAIPAGEEIAAVRRIIDRCEQLLAELTDDERAETEQAITVLRHSRAQLDTTVPVRFLGVIGQPSPTLFPNVHREQQARP